MKMAKRGGAFAAVVLGGMMFSGAAIADVHLTMDLSVKPDQEAEFLKVMTEAVAEVESRGEPIEVKVRDFLKVRRKQTCPRCGAKLRTAGVKGMDAWFCPHCQPARRIGLVDWTRTGR